MTKEKIEAQPYDRPDFRSGRCLRCGHALIGEMSVSEIVLAMAAHAVSPQCEPGPFYLMRAFE